MGEEEKNRMREAGAKWCETYTWEKIGQQWVSFIDKSMKEFAEKNANVSSTIGGFVE